MSSKTKVFNNAKWIILCKIVQSVLQLVVGMLSARYLGPSNYGLINYAASIVAFALPIMKLGFDAVIVYELVESPEKEGEIMGTSLCFNLLSGAACILGVSSFAAVANMGDTQTLLICALYSTSIIFAALEMIQYWFQYKLLSRYSSVVMLVSYVAVSAYKIFLLATGKSVYWFALSHSIEYGIIGALLIAIYKKRGGGRLSVSLARAKSMFAKSKHYILAALMVVVIQNTDHIMLTEMVGRAENGYYSAAITCTSVCQFVFVAIMDSFRPVILAAKNENRQKYENNLSQLYSIVIYLSLAQSVVFTVAARLIILLLYGADYMAAVPVLQILVWYCAFSFMGTVRNIWLLAEGKQRLLPAINLTGAVFNVALNAVMIPLWGACGAAFASLLTQVFTNFVLGFIIKPMRENNRLIIRGLDPRLFVRQLGAVAQMLLKRSGDSADL